MEQHFFAMISRMRYINRWGLMRNTLPENISEHSLQVAMIAHALTVIRNRYYAEGRLKLNPERVAVLAMYHDASEILTGDLPTPVKYFNPAIRDAYQAVESVATGRLLSMLPADLAADFQPILEPDHRDPEIKDSMALIKAADRISAYLKCVEEGKAGNSEFHKAGQATLNKIQESALPEVRHFMRDFVPSFSLTLDELESGPDPVIGKQIGLPESKT
jgi:5'-deoxynucleotidase